MPPWTPDPTPDDIPKDPTIARWFQALGPPPGGTASPHLYAKARAQLARQQAEQGLGGWLARLVMPRWAPVLVAILLVSLGFNVWWGLRAFDPQAPGALQGAGTRKDDGSPAQRLHTARFQSEMQHARALGTFVADDSALRRPPPIGFIPHATRTTFVRMGTLYAEALATLASGEVDATTRRLKELERSLTSVQAPTTLIHYLRAVHVMLDGQQSPGNGVVTSLALFEPLYEDAYVSLDKPEPILMFRTGAWLENMVLAATAGEAAALQRGRAALAEVRRTMTALQVPQNNLDALDRLHGLLSQETLTASDISTVRTLVQHLQEQLGA